MGNNSCHNNTKKIRHNDLRSRIQRRQLEGTNQANHRTTNHCMDKTKHHKANTRQNPNYFRCYHQTDCIQTTRNGHCHNNTWPSQSLQQQGQSHLPPECNHKLVDNFTSSLKSRLVTLYHNRKHMETNNQGTFTTTPTNQRRNSSIGQKAHNRVR